MSYCQNKSKAVVTAYFPDGTLKIVSTHPPVEISLQQYPSENFTHDMRSAIGEHFSKNVQDIVSTGGSWSPGLNKEYISCPTTTTIPVHSVYPDVSAQPLIISGNQVSGNFDSNYSDNLGTCSYQVSFKPDFVVTDITGEIFRKSIDTIPRCTVECEDNCPEGYLKCHSDDYPGYCCIPCEITKNRIEGLIASVKGLK